ncbi:hypothetical protein RE628_00740 [Paenibacillus sp. D2_2]|uniref:hypothetical protein n=1 Tax=Paenibacillus sp. D2_2 TaxID=3073092 RepID=UPI002814F8DE|nr:hypothetical protein [Paenibacillus sp. D2_2]WMT41182.1 hypothetical protein RE628_00740 [Paenibacillus sp. D2_2]
MNALKTKKVQGINDIKRFYNNRNQYTIFSELTDRNPILFAEFIPFHSKKFSISPSNMERAYNSDSLGFGHYFDGIIEVIKNSLDTNGLIIMDGSKPSELFKKMKEKELEELYLCEKYGIYEWAGKKVLLTSGVIFGMSSPFNNHDYIQEMIDKLFEICPEFVML